MNTQTTTDNITAMLKEAGIWEITAHLSYREIAEAIKAADHDLGGFAEACYDQNSVAELISALAGDADEADMESWDLDADEWRKAIEQALKAKAFDDIYDDLIDAENEWFDEDE